uniref:Uncharacterized protein n=1 Tax=Pithovirus LCDPAC01 TaxID=2506600 RepID=A0A481YQD8_9VIRU|nr:MAG: hypothetical protein LCDPAC01_01140 [Pithovirus LCDPAC01]
MNNTTSITNISVSSIIGIIIHILKFLEGDVMGRDAMGGDVMGGDVMGGDVMGGALYLIRDNL